jgi:hypothetical protein
MRLRQTFIAGIICGLVSTGAAGFAFGAEDEGDLARQLLTQALDNQYRGRYQATLETINENFAEGRDSLVGWAEFSDDVGERRICLAGSRKAFEYRSLDFGKEQWITDDNSRRIRRIANRQWRKGVFGNLLTYEDMLKMPSDFFLEYSSCKGVTVTDSTYSISMTLKPLYQSFYGSIDVTLAKNPVLLRSLTFYGTHGEKLKTLKVQGYKEVNGKWLVTDMMVADSDSLASLQMCFRNFSFVEQVAQAKEPNADMSIAIKRPSPISTRPFAHPPGYVREEMEDEGPEDVNN